MSVWIHASDLSGYAASALVFATFSMKSMRSLRIVAIASNLAFIAYALDGKLMPILILHSVLLPMNVVRLCQINRTAWPVTLSGRLVSQDEATASRGARRAPVLGFDLDAAWHVLEARN